MRGDELDHVVAALAKKDFRVAILPAPAYGGIFVAVARQTRQHVKLYRPDEMRLFARPRDFFSLAIMDIVREKFST